MAQRLVTSFVNTNIPGAYNEVTVKSNPVGLGSSGNVVIIGEADGGDSYQNTVLSNNSFTPDQYDRVLQTYLSGQIVDAFRAFTAPSNDADITGSANRIYIVKTNSSTKASAIVDTDYGIFKDQNFGANGNKYKFQITQTAAEVAPSYSGVAVPAFGAALNGATFNVRQNGGAAVVITLSATAGDHNNIANLLIELNTLLPAGLTAVEGAIANSVEIEMDADAAANRKGWGKSMELIETSAGDLASLGLAEGVYASSSEPSIEVSISRPDINFQETLDVSADIALFMGYEGTTATLTINKTTQMLTTTVVGGVGANLSINMSQYRTIADLADFINAQAGYSASASPAAQQLAPSALDAVAAIGIASTAADEKPGRVKQAAFNFQQVMATSGAFLFEATAQAGLPAAMTNPAFLAGGSRGNTLAADVVNAINQLAGIQVNIVIPLFSRDATADIADGMTSSGSTYTIDAVHAAVKSHCIAYSTPKLKRNRICVLSFWGNYEDSKTKAQGLANYRANLVVQRATQDNSVGVITNFLPWYTACIAAGMQAGGFYKSITNKLANVVSFQDPAGFDSGSPGDCEDALDAGLMFLTKETYGNRWVSDQTTYGYDTNFVYNSMQAVYASDILALDLTDSFQKAFVGKSLADVDAATALGFLSQKMDGYKKIKLIAASDDAPLGFKNAKINIVAPTMEVSVEIKLATAIYFIPISISVSQVQQSAS